MIRKRSALVASIGMALIATAASADPVVLDAQQMDQVTAAGITRDLSAAFTFTLGASLFGDIPQIGDDAIVTLRLIDESRPGVDGDGAAFTVSIQTLSLGIRGSNSVFRRSGGFQTSITLR